MTEAEWSVCSDPTRMLQAISVNTSDRRWRLFGCACCRRIWDLFEVDEWRVAVEVAERVADGQAFEEEREAAYLAAKDLYLEYTSDPSTDSPLEILPLNVESAYWQREEPDGEAIPAPSSATGSAVVCSFFHQHSGLTRRYIARYLAYHAAGAAANFSSGPAEAVYHNERTAQAQLLREIFGLRFEAVTFNSTWRTDTARALAKQMYESRSFSTMPILADALQDAGCENDDILNHCRGPGPHVRGCWVVDLVLGKE